jgi:threonine dehydrogenase-like Zn-dependent dehydrogenase
MRSVVLAAGGRVELAEFDEPRVEEPGDAVVRLTLTAICGSDLHVLDGKLPMDVGDPIGHEAVGVVEAVGDGVTRFRTGDRVAIAFLNVCGECWYCRQGESALCGNRTNFGFDASTGGLGGLQADAVRVTRADHNLLAIPDDVDDEHAVFVGDVLTTGWYGVALAEPRPGESVAVIGCGPVGYFAVQAARAMGVETVIGIDPVGERLELVRRQGAIGIDPGDGDVKAAVREATEGRGVDIAVDAVGNLGVFDAARKITRRGGRISVVGVYGDEESVELGMREAWLKTVQLRFAGVCPIQGWWERALAAVRAGDVDPIPLISHRLPLEEAQRGYELFQRREATKVLLVP